jgi:hypothetical protein
MEDCVVLKSSSFAEEKVLLNCDPFQKTPFPFGKVLAPVCVSFDLSLPMSFQ